MRMVSTMCQAFTKKGCFCKRAAFHEGYCNIHHCCKEQVDNNSWLHYLPQHILHAPEFTNHLEAVDWIKLGCTSKSVARLFEPWIRPLQQDPVARLHASIRRDCQRIEASVDRAKAFRLPRSPYITIQYWPSAFPHVCICILYDEQRFTGVTILLFDEIRGESTVVKNWKAFLLEEAFSVLTDIKNRDLKALYVARREQRGERRGEATRVRFSQILAVDESYFIERARRPHH